MENLREFFSGILQNHRTTKAKKCQLTLQDILICEKTALMVGYTFLPKFKNSPTKLALRNGIFAQVLLFLLLILLSISMVLCFNAEQPIIMIENVLFIGVVVIILCKIYIVFHLNLTKIHEITEKLDTYFPHSCVDQLNYKVHNYIRTVRLFNNILFFFYSLISFWLTFMPLFHQIYRWLRSVDTYQEFIFNFDLSYDRFNLIIFSIVFIMQAWTLYCSAVFIICTDLLFASVVEVIALELDILGDKISKIKVDNNEEEAIKELKMLIDVHQDLIETSEKFNEVYSLMQFFNAFISIPCICTASFLSMVKWNFLNVILI